ncbi:hypothetical protein U9M48_028202 [Paspalum notatum var. saurae]|uniref:Uncharacterized protein n=1 Tax=Paspalum notatum var. saurae TaxID=547442 RepID=A0AAQ3U0U5_PASNO
MAKHQQLTPFHGSLVQQPPSSSSRIASSSSSSFPKRLFPPWRLLLQRAAAVEHLLPPWEHGCRRATITSRNRSLSSLQLWAPSPSPCLAVKASGSSSSSRKQPHGAVDLLISLDCSSSNSSPWFPFSTAVTSPLDRCSKKCPNKPCSTCILTAHHVFNVLAQRTANHEAPRRSPTVHSYLAKVKASILVQFRSFRCQERNLTLVWCRGDGGHGNICYLIPHQGPEMELFTTAPPRFGIEPRLSSDPRTRIGGCEIMKTRKTTPELESDGLYSSGITTTPTKDRDELDDDHSYDGRNS